MEHITKSNFKQKSRANSVFWLVKDENAMFHSEKSGKEVNLAKGLNSTFLLLDVIQLRNLDYLDAQL